MVMSDEVVVSCLIIVNIPVGTIDTINNEVKH